MLEAKIMRHCLVVDDSEVIRKVAHHIIEELDMAAMEVESAQEALERCKHAMPDVILLDWQLPTMSSSDFLYLLRRNPGGDRPFVIYCTTEHDVEDITRALDAGANDYLMKPYDIDSIGEKMLGAGMITRQPMHSEID